MRWSLKIATIAGIGIYVHWTFVLIVAWIAYIYASQAGRASAALDGVVFVLAVFACIVAHELGHALMARRFGIGTRNITLLPIGGVARLERMPEDPVQELLVAVAGPIVTAVLAVAFFAISVPLHGEGSLLMMDPIQSPLLVRLAWVNAFLLAFNLLPAFPMDGGRVLRALLHMAMDYAKATRVAAVAGQVMAVLFGIFGLLVGNVFLVIIAVFVFLGAQSEVHAAQVKFLTSGATVRQAMVTQFRTIPPGATLKDAVQVLLAGEQQDFPVVENGAVLGVLTRADLMRAVATDGVADRPVAEIMNRECKPAQEDDVLEGAFARMRENGCPVVPVLRRGELVGMLTLENIGEWMMVRSAIREHESSRERGAR